MRDGLSAVLKANDNNLLSLIRKNDNDAFRLLYKRYWGPLINFAAHYLDDKDSCKEIVQELFVQMHVQQVPLRIKSSLSSYLFTALRNKIFNYLRNRAVYKKHVCIAARAAVVNQNNVEQFVNMKQLQEKIALFLGNIPGKYREVYMLHDQDSLTIRKISELLKRPVNTVEKQFRKATTLLREHLRDCRMNIV